MVQFSHGNREIVLKIVYYGPALSGKTTNLQAIFSQLDANRRGRLMTLNTRDDRTLFFDLLPVFFQTETGVKVKIKLFTVPGQVMHNSTRRVVLAGADAIVFIADAQRSMTQANNESWLNMLENLRENGLDPNEIPIVIQFNKMDLPDVRTKADIAEIQARGPEPIFLGVATKGKGVLETLHSAVSRTWDSLEARHQFSEKFRLARKDFVNGIFSETGLGTVDPSTARFETGHAVRPGGGR